MPAFANAVEKQLAAKIRTTQRLIDVEGRMVALFRPPEGEDDGAGGRLVPVGEPTPFPPVRRYFGGKINNRMNNVPFESVSSIGEYIRINTVLIGMPGDDIQELDYFFMDGLRYSVKFVYPEQTFEIRADCVHVGT